MAERSPDYRAFWPRYLAEHSKPATQMLHAVGTGLGLVLLVIAIVTSNWWLLPLALVAVGLWMLGSLFHRRETDPDPVEVMDGALAEDEPGDATESASV